MVKNYTVKKDLLYKLAYRDNKVWLLLVVPVKLRIVLLQVAHDEAGHLGITKTYSNIFEKYFWPRCLTDVYKYVQSCPTCQRKKKPKSHEGGYLQPIPIIGPFHTIGIDYMGPFVTSRKRNKYLIVAVDHFSKWVECKAVKSATAANAATFFVEQICNRFGAPKRVLSDRGSHFTGALFRNVLKLFQSDHVCTASYNPQCNGAVERMNQTLAISLSHYVDPCHRDWDSHLTHIAWSINTTKQESTKFSPYEILFGHPPINPVDHALGFDGFAVELEINPYVTQLRNWITTAHEIIKTRLNKLHDQNAIYFNNKRDDISYEVGDLVLLRTPPDQSDLQGKDPMTGLTTKLLFTYNGPWRVDEKISPVNYRITLVPGNKKKRKLITDVVHVKRLKPYYERDSLEDTNEVTFELDIRGQAGKTHNNNKQENNTEVTAAQNSTQPIKETELRRSARLKSKKN